MKKITALAGLALGSIALATPAHAHAHAHAHNDSTFGDGTNAAQALPPLH
ncbi:MAG: hypothetical protein WCD21_07365 [Streptomyces sp.]